MFHNLFVLRYPVFVALALLWRGRLRCTGGSEWLLDTTSETL